ncbi:MAG: peptide ABC transporter substrate-binding protein [Thermomicrobiales bacterium]
MTSATFVFLEGLLWSDGKPVTADDLIFTWKWVTTPENSATSIAQWNEIAGIEAKDDRTAVVTFKKAAATWFEPFAGNYNGNLYPAHVFGNDPSNKNDAFLLAPIGTGPYVVSEFKANDAARYAINEHYRDPNKPYFKTIYLKGGGDPASAGRAVLQTGEFDYAWNLQVEPEIITEMATGSQYGAVFSEPGTTVEMLNFNFSDPRKEVDGQRSQKDTPHPLFSQLEVRKALNLAVDRALIAKQLYNTESEPPTANILTGLESFTSPNTTWSFDLDAANAVLDEAGWMKDGKTRSKDGVTLSFDYWTSITPVRQKTQAIVKADWEKLGAAVELQQVDGAIFFGGDATNEQNFYHMYWDLDMWANWAILPPADLLDGALVRRAERREYRPEGEWLGKGQHPTLQQPGLRRTLRATGEYAGCPGGGEPPDPDERHADRGRGGDPDRAAGVQHLCPLESRAEREPGERSELRAAALEHRQLERPGRPVLSHDPPATQKPPTKTVGGFCACRSHAGTQQALDAIQDHLQPQVEGGTGVFPLQVRFVHVVAHVLDQPRIVDERCFLDHPRGERLQVRSTHAHAADPQTESDDVTFQHMKSVVGELDGATRAAQGPKHPIHPRQTGIADPSRKHHLGRGPGMPLQRLMERAGAGAQGVLPGKTGGRGGDLSHDTIERAEDNVILAAHVVIEGHGFHTERLAQPTHAHRLQSVGVDQCKSGGHDPVAGEGKTVRSDHAGEHSLTDLRCKYSMGFTA